MRARPRHIEGGYVAGVVWFIVAGWINVFARTLPLHVDLFLSLGASMIFVGLALAWGVSMQHRLLPGHMRTYTVVAACLMALWMLLRAYKYRVVAVDNVTLVLCWYGYYVCHLGIACLLFCTCLDLWERERGSIPAARVCVVAAVLLFACVMLTNNAHQLVFAFNGAAPADNVPYTYGPLYYAMIVLIYGLVAVSVLILARLHHLPYLAGKSIGPLLALAASGVLAVLICHVLEPLGLHSPYNYPELVCFTLLLIWEWLVRARLIPSNARYAELFGAMIGPLCIADAHMQRMYETRTKVRAVAEDMNRALGGPVVLDPDTLLEGTPLAVGYAFWEVDISLVNRINDELSQTHEELSDQNDLLAALNELEGQQALLEAREELMNEVVRSFTPQLQELKTRVAGLRADGISATGLAALYVRGTYIKRAMNLRLLAAEQEGLDGIELVLSLRESVRALSMQGVEGAVAYTGEGRFAPGVAERLFDAYEQVVEGCEGELERMLVHVDVRGASLSCSLEPSSLLPRLTAVGFACEEADGALYIRITGEGGVL